MDLQKELLSPFLWHNVAGLNVVCAIATLGTGAMYSAGRIMMNKNQRIAILFMGFAWPLVGLGFMALHFGYLPSGLSLFAQGLGLFIAGTLSGGLYLTVRRVFEKSLGAGLINVGYLLFAPISIMTALVAPGLVEEAGSPTAYVLVTPIMISIYANAAMAAGLGMTGSLAIAARILVDRSQPGSDQVTEAVNYDN